MRLASLGLDLDVKFAADMFLGDVKLDWVHTFKYLGIVFNSGFTLNVDISYTYVENFMHPAMEF